MSVTSEVKSTKDWIQCYIRTELYLSYDYLHHYLHMPYRLTNVDYCRRHIETFIFISNMSLTNGLASLNTFLDVPMPW